MGKIFVTKTSEPMGSRWIVNFPTKQHWRGKSLMHWVVDGLADLRRFIVENDVRSIAIPALGAGLGGLEWVDVKPRIGEALVGLDAVEVFVYEPIP